jgi:hypothetical protein
MGKGYAEGPAAEAAAEARDRQSPGRPRGPKALPRRAVYGCTKAKPQIHEMGWADDLDVDALFASGAAWGLHVRSVAAH